MGSSAMIARSISTLGAVCLLVFCLLYTPCIAAVASIKRELGGKWALFVIVGQCILAWIMAFLVHCVGFIIGLR